MTPRRPDARIVLAAALACLGAAASGPPLAAQVGHDPARSPYRDIVRGSGPVFVGGRLTGDRGRAQVGPANGTTAGLRYDLQLGRATVLQFGASYLRADRFIMDPEEPATSPGRRTGPVTTEILLTEIAMQLRLTGGKTWHGLAPYIGVGSGLAFDVNSPGDTTGSRYTFGTKLLLSGGAGVRWYAAPRVAVHADLRGVLWRLGYPSSFHQPASDGSRVVPLDQPLRDWTLHPWVSLGVGWTF